MLPNRHQVIVLVVIALHICQGIALWIDPSVTGVTTISSLSRLFSRYGTVAIFFGVAWLAFWSFYVKEPLARMLLMIPQQFVLLIAAVGAMTAIQESHFADGVLRPMWFLFADQVWTILVAGGHYLAILNVSKSKS